MYKRQPVLDITYLGNGLFSFSKLLPAPSGADTAPDAPLFALSDLDLKGGTILLRDGPVGMVHTVSDVNFHVPLLRSADLPFAPTLSALVNGTRINVEGRTEPDAETLRTTFAIHTAPLHMEHFKRYLSDFTPLNLNSGTVAVSYTHLDGYKRQPAYLLSGTRGVVKTTIARIFAKALNCVHAPTGEPCNQCEQCRRITMGNHVDVVEIDGASNRGIDDARRLREAIAYAPMEGRYKVFIIDEAHMLTRESFNALLKTLEEPPPRATFILATTEAHKFPITIVSRCQHFIFKAIPEAELVAHLTRVLNKEGIPFEENAVRLLARRAAGSVRDSMSLLGQTLALGGDHLTEASTRSVLGLAGQELRCV